MFDLSEVLLAHWQAEAETAKNAGKPIERWSHAEVDQVQALYGLALPEDYIAFMAQYGAVTFPFDGPNRFMYSYQVDGMKEFFEGFINSFLNIAALKLQRTYMIEEPENNTDEPFYPADMIPFAGTPGQDLLLLGLTEAQSGVWYWEDQPEAWGTGRNTRLGHIAPDFRSFLESLK